MKQDLTKPNPHVKKPLFEGLPWTADDFNLLSQYLSAELITYVEDGEGPFDDEKMNRLLDMKDECAKIYSESECAQYRNEWFHTRKAIRDLERERNTEGLTIEQQVKKYEDKLKATEKGLKKLSDTICFKNSGPAAFQAFNNLKADRERYSLNIWILTEASEDEIKNIMQER